MAAHPLDAVALKALGHGAAPVGLIYNQAFNVPSGPWFQMFTTAVYDGNMTLALHGANPVLLNSYSRRLPSR